MYPWDEEAARALEYTDNISVGLPAATSGDFASNLIHYWPMTDAQVSGTTVNDIQGGVTFNGTSAGNVASGTGPPNPPASTTYPQGRVFDGVSGTETNGALSPFAWNSGAFTVATWLYIASNNSASGGGSSQRYFIDDIDGTGTNYFQMLNLSGIPGGIRATTSSGQLNSTSTAVVSSTWTHFVLTNSTGGSGGLQTMYIGGSVAATSTASGADNSGGVITCRFGNLSGSDGQLTGRLAGFRIYSRALSSVDVAALFAAGG